MLIFGLLSPIIQSRAATLEISVSVLIWDQWTLHGEATPAHLLTAHLSTCSLVYLFICSSVHLPPIHLLTCPPVHLLTCPPVHLPPSTCSLIHLFTCSLVYLLHLSTCSLLHMSPIHLLTCPPAPHPPAHLSRCPPICLLTSLCFFLLMPQTCLISSLGLPNRCSSLFTIMSSGCS